MTAALIITFGLFFYLLPSVISTTRKVRHDGAIVLVNVVFRWTILGWIAALIGRLLSIHGIHRAHSKDLSSLPQIATSGLRLTIRFDSSLATRFRARRREPGSSSGYKDCRSCITLCCGRSWPAKSRSLWKRLFADRGHIVLSTMK